MQTKREKKLINIIYFVLVSIVPLLFVKFKVDGDTYWIIKTGEYIVNNSIPTKDFLTMHTTMDLVVQQWLSDVIFYGSYKLLGFFGVILIPYIMLFVFTRLTNKLASIYTNRRMVRMMVLLFTNILAAMLFFVTRPQVFTYCIILCELIMLEKFIETKNWKYLIALPFLSVLSVNLHASMWTMQFIILLPYLANALPIKLGGKSISCCSIKPLIVSALGMLAGGFVNPYGVKGLAFIFTTSIGNEVNSRISELEPITLAMNISDIFYVSTVAVVILAYMLIRGKTKPRFVLLTAGTMVMALCYIKLLGYFIFISYTAILVYFDSVDFKALIKFDEIKARMNEKNSKKPKKNADKPKDDKDKSPVLMIAFLAILVLFVIVINIDNIDYINNGYKIEAWQEVDSAVASIEQDSKKNDREIVLFNTFNVGGYLEFLGYQAFIDPRADSFVEEANHEFDYLQEYYDFTLGELYYKDVVDKYNFTYLLVSSTEGSLHTNLSNDSDYQIIFEGENFLVFTREG